MSAASRRAHRRAAAARLGVVLVVATSSGVGLVYFAKGLSELGRTARDNGALSYGDREIAGGNGVVVDQEAPYEAQAIIPAGRPYRVLEGPGLTGATGLTRPFVASWFRYYLMPRRPRADARWIVCYGCDVAALGRPFAVRWSDRAGISIGRLR